MHNSKSCGHPIIGTGGCCIRCATRVHQSRLTYRKAQVAVLERVTAQLKASLEPEYWPHKPYHVVRAYLKNNRWRIETADAVNRGRR